jgi:HEAT repeat protein
VILLSAFPAPSQNKDTDSQSQNQEVAGKTLDAWIEDLKDSDPSVKELALRAISNYGSAGKRASAAIVGLNLLSHGDISVRVNSCITLGVIGIEDKSLNNGVAGLVKALSDPQGIVRFQAAMALGRLGSSVRNALGYSAAVNHLSQYTIRDNNSWEIRKAGAFALGPLGAGTKADQPDNRAVTALLNAIGPVGDACSQVRLEALFSLSMIVPTMPISEGPRLRPNIEFRALKDKDKLVNIYARLLLMQIDPSYLNDDNLKAIAKLLEYPDLQVRLHVVRVLHMLGERAQSTIPLLIAAIRDKETPVANGAAAALVGMKDAVTDAHLQEIAKMLKAEETHVRVHACQALTAFGEKARLRINDLIAVLNDKEPAVLVAACMALSELGEYGKPAVPALEQVARHMDDTVKEAALLAIDFILYPVASKSKQ